jgi:hypothetical protein
VSRLAILPITVQCQLSEADDLMRVLGRSDCAGAGRRCALGLDWDPVDGLAGGGGGQADRGWEVRRRLALDHCRVIIAYGQNTGDCPGPNGPVHGYVVSIPETGGPELSPARQRQRSGSGLDGRQLTGRRPSEERLRSQRRWLQPRRRPAVRQRRGARAAAGPDVNEALLQDVQACAKPVPGSRR